jgi:regulatory protein SWI6
MHDTWLISAAITTLLSETEKEFLSEMEAKQSAIDAIHVSLRDSSASLGTARHRLERLQARDKDRNDRRLRTNNYRRAAEDEQFRLSQISQSQGHMANGDAELHLGDADKAFRSLPADLPASTIHQNPQLVQSLPSAATLRARLAAYDNNNTVVEQDVQALKAKSRELEAKYRRVISLCTKVDEGKVDSVLGSLCRAVESETGDVELGRVRDFLMKVDGVGE